jgi:hypothetical protein
MNNADGSALSQEGWNNRKFDTKIDERRETTIVDFEPDKERGRINKNSDDHWR